jgi:hypothetical protein
MIDRANHWFYAERQLTPGATVEKMRQNLWSYGFYNIWLTLTKKEPPYVLSGLWGTDKFEIEFEPRKFLIIRLAKDNEWLKTAFTRALGMSPHFWYQERGSTVYEWRMADREGRWQAMQGLPTFKSLKRLYELAEA